MSPDQLAADLPLEQPAPGKLILFGEHATVYGHPGIAAPIDIGMSIRIHRDPEGPRLIRPRFRQCFGEREPESSFGLFSSAVAQGLAIYGLQNAEIAVEVEAALPVGMGLGSSAAFSAGVCRALRRCAGRADDNGLFEDVQQLESVFHGTPSGMDAATVLAGGVLRFRKGPPPDIRPVPLGASAGGLICIVETGGSTLAQVDMVRRLFEDDEKRIGGLLAEIGELTGSAETALVSGDLVTVGLLMDRNHGLLSRLGVSTPKLDAAVGLLRRQNGVLGAKLTGAGGGGAVIALTSQERRQPLVTELQEQFALVFPFTAAHQQN